MKKWLAENKALALARLLPAGIRRRLLPRYPLEKSVISSALPDGGKLKFFYDESDVLQSMVWGKGYETETADFIFEKSKSARVMIDVGANVGYHSLLGALSSREIQLFSFEPHPALFARLVENIALNGLESRVHACCCAVSHEEGETQLYAPKSKILSETSIVKEFRSDAEVMNCRAQSLDRFVEENKISGTDLVKIDVEGAEGLVLKGMRSLMKKEKPDIICEVLPGRFAPETQSLLEEYGYRFYWITGSGLVSKQTIEGDRNYRYQNFFFTTKHL